MKSKVFIIPTIILLFLCLVIGCFIYINSGKGEVSADYPYYSDIESMTNKADIIVIGEVITAKDVQNIQINLDVLQNNDIDSSYVDMETIAYTISKIKITQVIKGNIEVGDIITVKQLGDYKNQPDSAIKGIDGYFEKGSQQLLFLNEYKYNIPYDTLNVEQCSLEVVDDNLIVKGNNTILENNTPISTVVEKIKNIVINNSGK